jgi:hypothetical protein
MVEIPDCSWLTWNGGLVRRLAEAAYREMMATDCDECVDGDVGCPHCEGAGVYYDPPYSLNRLKCPDCDDGLLPGKCRKCDGAGHLASGHLDPACMGVLADALEESGCDDPAILGHLRTPAVHVRGCHIVDLLTGRE